MPANGARLTMIFEQRGSIPVLQVRIIQLMHKIHYTRFLVSLVYILSTIHSHDAWSANENAHWARWRSLIQLIANIIYPIDGLSHGPGSCGLVDAPTSLPWFSSETLALYKSLAYLLTYKSATSRCNGIWETTRHNRHNGLLPATTCCGLVVYVGSRAFRISAPKI